MREYMRGLQLLSAFMVGRIPVHQVRLFVYRWLLRVEIGRDTSFHWRTVFRAPEKVRVGRNSIIGNDAFIDGRRGVLIGNNVNIGGHVHIHTMQHDPDDPFFAAEGGPVVIEDYVYVGSRVSILPGVRIGRGAVVATGSIVTRDVPEFVIVGGAPARRIRERSRDLRYVLKYHHPFQ